MLVGVVALCYYHHTTQCHNSFNRSRSPLPISNQMLSWRFFFVLMTMIDQKWLKTHHLYRMINSRRHT